MPKIKEFILSHKKILLAVIIILIAVISVVCVAVISSGKQKSGSENKSEVKTFKDWDNLIADLEAEPVSELDEKYEDDKSLSGTPYKLVVNKTKNLITVYEKDKDSNYTKEVKKIICSVGYDTPVGTFTTSDKYTWKIVNGNVWAQNVTRVVGNVLIHSMPYHSKDKATLIPSYYNQLGRTLSASCIRVSAGDSEWIMKNCPKGMTVEIIEAEEDVVRPLAIKVPEDAVWDPTDTDASNPWNSVVLAFEGLEAEKTIERGYQFDYMEGVTIKDTCGNDISSNVQIITDMDIYTPGVYEVTYSVSDATGKTAEQKVKFNVTDTQSPKLCGLMSTLYFSSVADVTQENILDDVAILDNNQIMSAEAVSLVIPQIIEGVNQVTINAADAYGNIMTTTINVIVDSNPPQIALKNGVDKNIPLAVVVDREYALSRVDITDIGQQLKDLTVSVTIIPQLWGYDLNYKVTDKQGNTSTLKDHVEYVDYTIIPSGKLVVTDIENKAELLNGVTVKCSDGTLANTEQLEYTVTELADGEYEVVYSLKYSSALGDKTITAKDTFTLEGALDTPGVDLEEDGIVEQTPVLVYTQEP